MVRLKADPNVGGVSYDGQEYPMVKGCIEVPDEAAKVLLALGCGLPWPPGSRPRKRPRGATASLTRKRLPPKAKSRGGFQPPM